MQISKRARKREDAATEDVERGVWVINDRKWWQMLPLPSHIPSPVFLLLGGV